MPKVNKPGSQQPEQNAPKKSNTGGTSSPSPNVVQLSTSSSSTSTKGKQRGKSGKSTIGGTAVPGAKSTQPKEIKSTNAQEQQAESYNREMRRRMQHMGVGPTAENAALNPRQRRLKRLERKRQERLTEVKKTVAKGPKPNTALGRRNLYFLIGVVALLVLLIVLFILIRHPF
jgi:hypothetical protein